MGGYWRGAVALWAIVDAAMALDHGVLQGCCWRAGGIIGVCSVGGYVEVIADIGCRGHVVAIGAILDALDAVEEVAGKGLGRGIGGGRVGVVSVVGLRVASGGVQRGDANARAKRLAARDVGGRGQRRFALDGNLLGRGAWWRR